MERCFVIQPFDNDKFDLRYVDIFKPAIEKAELEPYRIDRDLSVRIPIDKIEEEIRKSSICFADISLNNPNVWYELGYAFACEKDVIMVCSEERTERFPFDIQHRHIISYRTGSKSDFENLEDIITKKIRAFKITTNTVKSLNKAPIQAQEGLESHEIAMLVIIMENQLTDDAYSVFQLKHQMNSAGYTDIATSVGVRSLVKKGMIETLKAIDQDHDMEYSACKLTENGESWILENQDRLQFRKLPNNNFFDPDNLPF